MGNFLTIRKSNNNNNNKKDCSTEQIRETSRTPLYGSVLLE